MSTPKTITDILETLVALVSPEEDGHSAYDTHEQQVEAAEEASHEATQAIKDYILSEIIGEDELTTGNEFTYRGDGKSHREIEVENFLRARQRNRLRKGE